MAFRAIIKSQML